ncbi:MAG: hypothetical protein HY331_14920 [Chloroflexi bacterium]|nr:hypothetical protein [Chloroflexota bacterium]
MPKRYPTPASRGPAGRPKQATNKRRRATEPAAETPAASSAPAVATAPRPSPVPRSSPMLRPGPALRVAVRPNPPPVHVNYDYVLRDLRRIALTAGPLIAGLVVLSFVLR